VAAFAPARHTGYVESLETTPPSPKIWRSRTEGEEYLIVMDSPIMVADAWAAGLWG
jgi:hypothetical protein